MNRPHSAAWRALFGFLLVCWLAFLSAIGITIARSLGVRAAPELLDLLPKGLDWVHKQALIVQVGIWLGVVILLALGALLTYHAWKESERRGNQKDSQFVERLGDAIRKAFDEKSSTTDIKPAPPGDNLEAFIYPSQLPRPVPFIGRQDLILTMKEAILDGNTLNICAVEGRAGIGKTALAAEVVGELLDDDQRTDKVHQPKRFPGGAAWVSCEGLIGNEGMDEFWEKVAIELRLDRIAEITNLDERLRALKDVLQQRPRTLIVLDNIEPNLGSPDRSRTAEQIISKLFVPDHTVLLMTARHEIDLPGRIRAVPLRGLDAPSAKDLFSKLLKAVDPDHVRPNEADLSAIDDIVTYTEGLPFLITLLASFAGRRQIALSQLSAQLKSAGPPSSVEQKVTRSIALSWKVLTPSQQRLFAGISLLGNLTFPFAAAQAIANAAAKQSDPVGNPDGDLETLVSYYLIGVLPKNAGYRLHRDLRNYGKERFDDISSKEERAELGIAAVAYWLNVGKKRPRWKQLSIQLRRHFVSAQIRRVKEKEEWMNKFPEIAITN